jgi:putative acetyltransferase
MSHTLHLMNITDYEETYALWLNTEGVGLNEADTREAIALFLKRNPGMSFVARDAAGKLIGAVLGGHDGRRGYLHHLAVLKAQRGQGVGKQLVESCLAAFKADGINRCNIFVYSHNEEGQSFWKHFDWLPRTELLVMQKKL